MNKTQKNVRINCWCQSCLAFKLNSLASRIDNTTRELRVRLAAEKIKARLDEHGGPWIEFGNGK